MSRLWEASPTEPSVRAASRVDPIVVLRDGVRIMAVDWNGWTMRRRRRPSDGGVCGRRPWRAGRAAALVALLGAFACPVSAQPARAPACADRPVFGWLDFWVGDWRVFVGDQQVGTNRVVKVLDGCAVTEEWTDARGSKGQSLFYVAPGSGQWRQVWVTDTALAPGGVKEKQLVARFPDGALRFQGEIAAGGVVVLDRTTLTLLDDGRVRQVIERSDDGGATWQTGFDAVYVRVSGAG